MSYGQEASHAQLDRRSHGYMEAPAKYGFGRTKNKKGLLGLSNLGNTCFMNSALQCLTHTHGLQKYFRLCSHAYTSKSQSSRQRLLMAFAHWFERDWGKNVTASYHSPEDILRSLQSLNPIFQGYQQQDSQEFLRCVLDSMHEELRREVPDDLHGHLARCFGIDQVPLQLAAPGNQQSSGSGADGDMAAGRSGVGSSALSSTAQFMQLCQTTEGVTDAGEICLSGGKPNTLLAPGSKVAGSQASSSASSATSASDVATGSATDSTCSLAGGEGTKRVPMSGSTPASSSSSPSATAKEEREPEEPGTHFASIISELFQGKIVSIVRCMECNRTSRTQEVIFDVSVPIPNPNEGAGGPAGEAPPCAPPGHGQNAKGPTWAGMLGGIPGRVKGWFYDKGVDVSDCLRKYCAPEYLTGRDKYFCEHCKRKNDCEKRIAFKEPPELLVIHIKRFRYDASWFNGTKNSRVVTFPVTRQLDLSPYVDGPPQGPAEYKLVGLIQHIGSMGGGHYIAYCQHKREAQDWWEFDDAQVTSVSPEQVERAEPYVLFYQRVPSKGNKHDRQTFKTDRRRMEQLIGKYLMAHPPVPGAAPGAAATAAVAGVSRQLAAQQAVEEMRHHGPMLRSLYKAPPAELDVVFVTKHWYVRLTTMSQPGPIDNYEHLCPHKLLGCYSSEMAAEPFIPISRSLFQALVQKYGGGPVVESLEICPRCQTRLRAYNDRKQAEFDLVSKYDTKDTGEGRGWYLVDALWVNRWKRYVRGEHAIDIRDMCAPGPITNERLYNKLESTCSSCGAPAKDDDPVCKRCGEKRKEENPGAPRQNLRLRIDYIGVNARVWWLFMHVHGGGPPICREELDIYSAWHEPETELRLDELRGRGAADFARRVSRQFVDECHGDLSLYERIYGHAEEEAGSQPAGGSSAAAPSPAAAHAPLLAPALSAEATSSPPQSEGPRPSAAVAAPAQAAAPTQAAPPAEGPPHLAASC